MLISYARCYLGGAGVAEALRQGCDIVIYGRVADAAPTIGAAMWWQGWKRGTIWTRLQALSFRTPHRVLFLRLWRLLLRLQAADGQVREHWVPHRRDRARWD